MESRKTQVAGLISVRRLLFWYGLLLALLFSFHYSSLGEYSVNHLAQKSQFMIREWLGAAPDLDPRIRIYAHDDPAVHKLKQAHLELYLWGKIVEIISKSDPKMIIIDKKFGIIDNKHEMEGFRDILKSSAPVIVGGFTHHRGNQNVIYKDSLIDWGRKEYDLNMLSKNNIANADWIRILNHDAYGPHTEISGSFYRVGHINYDHFGKVEPFRRVSKDRALPHMTLLTADSLVVEDEILRVNDNPVYLDNEHLLNVNFPSVRELYSKTLSLHPVVARAKKNLTLKKVKKDDVVIILPLFFTGNADMAQSPIGIIPRGYVIVSLVNSVLTNNWLRPVNLAGLFIILGSTIGTVCGIFLGPVIFWIILLSLCILFFMFSMGLFSYYGVILPWFSTLLALLLGGVMFFSVKMSRQSRISKAYEIALSGLVSRKSLRELVRNPAAISREASEQLLTIMFLDMVSFSSMAEKEHPRVIFDRLKDHLGHFSQKVHEFGGVVDKTLGDGMLCFFGYNYIGGKTTKNHADQAISCAESIQIEHVKRSLAKTKYGEPMVPLRIGINSAKVYIGDLGDQDRIDFTLIGDGVNFAQRLEAACEPFSIMMSEESLHFASKYEMDDPGMKTRQIKIKHHQKLFQVIEYQPFKDMRELLNSARRAFHEKYELLGRAPRWPMEYPERIRVLTTAGEGTIINFSLTGLAMLLKEKKGPGETISVELQDNTGTPEVKAPEIPSMVCEVRWVTEVKNGFTHGLKIISLADEERKEVHTRLKEIVSKLA